MKKILKMFSPINLTGFTSVMCTAGFFSFITIQFYMRGYNQSNTRIRLYGSDHHTDHVIPKTILPWSGFWGEHRYDSWETLFYRMTSGQCPESNCILLFDKRFASTADAILFHPPNQKRLNYTFPKERNSNQFWIFFTLEGPPIVEGMMKTNLKEVSKANFNWTMTYRRDSDIYMPYGLVSPRTDFKKSQKLLEYDDMHWAKKDLKRMAIWMVSHCNAASKRDNFVWELKKHMSVDVYGKCGKLKCGLHIVSDRPWQTGPQSTCNKLISSYYYYLSFENSLCKDYVTEKFFKALTLDVIPVVFGGADYTAYAPSHSYIDALSFSSPESLAAYLEDLARNETAYNSYFKWKTDYQVDASHPSSEAMICDLCAKLHGKSLAYSQTVFKKEIDTIKMVPKAFVGRSASTGSYPDIHSWFSLGSNCHSWKGYSTYELDTPHKNLKEIPTVGGGLKEWQRPKPIF